jgi:hypothetical protein
MRRKFIRGMHKLCLLWRQRKLLAEMVERHAFFREHRGITVWGGISEEDECGLREAVARAATAPGPIVEIGALFGWTTQLLASLKSPEKELIAVENFSWNPFCIPATDHRVLTRRTLHYCIQHCRTRIFDGSAREFYESYRGPKPSMVFIDGDHSYEGVQTDIRWALERDVPVIAGHDFQASLHEPIVRAVSEQFANEFDLFGTVWVARGSAAENKLSRAA